MKDILKSLQIGKASGGDFIRERPFNLKGGGGNALFLKQYSDSQCC